MNTIPSMYTTDQFPQVMDFSDVFAPTGASPSGTIASVTSVCVSPVDLTIVGYQIINYNGGTDNAVAITLTGGNTGVAQQQTYYVTVKVVTNLGYIFTWIGSLNVTTPVC